MYFTGIVLYKIILYFSYVKMIVSFMYQLGSVTVDSYSTTHFVISWL